MIWTLWNCRSRKNFSIYIITDSEGKKSKIKLEWKIIFFPIDQASWKGYGCLSRKNKCSYSLAPSDMKVTFKGAMRSFSVFRGWFWKNIKYIYEKQQEIQDLLLEQVSQYRLWLQLLRKILIIFGQKRGKKQTHTTTEEKNTITVLSCSTIHLTPIWNKTKQAKLSNLFLNISLEAICSCWGFVKVSYLSQYTQQRVFMEGEFIFKSQCWDRSSFFSLYHLHLLIYTCWFC